MPPYKAPSKLYACACKKFNDMLDVTCHNIWQSHGAYNNDSTVEAISYVQNILTTSIPVSVLDDVINSSKAGKFVSECSISNGDIKIIFSLIMHRHMRIFKINKLEIPNTVSSRIEESFWISHLSRMSNLVFLDLSLICTDQILKIVGQCCTQLEEVTVISKMSLIPKGGSFNALRKVYHVSDQGLSYLTQCQKLKCVTINRSNRSGLGEITEKGICVLICNLPNLKSINYEYMGAVLAHIPLTSFPLCLQHLKDLRVNPASISLYNTLCPSLINLQISLPTNLCHQDIVIQSAAIAEALSNSSLMLSLLHQSFIHITHEVLASFLAKKGTNLVCIIFGLGCSNFDLEALLIIGRYCPNVEELAINTMTPDTTTLPKHANSMFQRLTSLHLSGKFGWNVKHVLSLCLQGQTVSDIYLCGAKENLNDIIKKLIASKKLVNVKHLFLHRDCYISATTVWQILQECPQINRLVCLFNHTFTLDEIESFQKFINNNNYDVDLRISDWPYAF